MTTLQEKADALQIVPRKDALLQILQHGCMVHGRADAQLAPIWAEKLRHTYQKVLEVKYPDLQAANGDVLPIDTSVDPADLEWEYFMRDSVGYADWIDDEGKVMPGSASTWSRFTGKMAEMGHEWDLNFFDLERAAKAGVDIKSYKQRDAKRAHDAKAQWVWLFGDSAKDLPGLCTHPNISVTMAALVTTPNPDSRLWTNKTNDEILDDLATLINTVPNQTNRQYFVGTVWMPASLMQLCLSRMIASTASGTVSLWDVIKARYSGDETGQGKVTFRILNECEAARRLEPITNTDLSGISGDFMLAIAAGLSTDEAAFIRARPYTQRPPLDMGFTLHHKTHSKIGGCKLQVPTAVHRMDFGTV